jgi:2-methylisocitrate lyase-like PEP mutase family enzyme
MRTFSTTPKPSREDTPLLPRAQRLLKPTRRRSDWSVAVARHYPVVTYARARVLGSQQEQAKGQDESWYTSRRPKFADRMRTVTLKERCDRLRALHVRDTPLVLPNAWDAASARAVVAAGFPVVATTSGGVAEALGYEDHERAPAVEMFAAAARIARSVEVPISVDAESGYGLAPDELIASLLDAGAAGCNLEDTDHKTGGLDQLDCHAARLASIRREATARGYGLVINARVDVFLADHGERSQKQLDEGIARARAYLDAGADCVYPIFLHDEPAIAKFVEAAGGPVNILAWQAPPVSRLGELGVARISYGSSIQRRLLQDLAAILAEIRG